LVADVSVAAAAHARSHSLCDVGERKIYQHALTLQPPPGPEPARAHEERRGRGEAVKDDTACGSGARLLGDGAPQRLLRLERAPDGAVAHALEPQGGAIASLILSKFGEATNDEISAGGKVACQAFDGQFSRGNVKINHHIPAKDNILIVGDWIFILEEIDAGVDLDEITVKRFNSSKNPTNSKPPPIQVALKSKEDKLKVLKAAKKLKTSSSHKGIFINPDYTKLEMEATKKLNAERNKLNENLPNEENGKKYGLHKFGNDESQSKFFWGIRDFQLTRIKIQI
jgi:hypothetical protein